MSSSPVTAGPVTVKDQEIAAEQERVDEAYARLAEMRADAQAMIKEGYRQALAGTKGSLVDRDAMVYQAAVRARALDIADDGLVFGRLDLDSREIRYIGRIGVRTPDHESLVIDWRAPAAEAFYRATPEDPRGVVRRRVLHTRGHTVVDLEDDLLDPSAADALTIVGDGAFLASLARTREGAMRDIVATIQREQDEVIRAPADGTVLVRGAPGTGKTAVALHRVAYLLFRHRQRFGSRGVLVVGPNRRFTAYIERVLPSLGEGSAVLRSLGDLVNGVSATMHDPPEPARIKGSAAMVPVLRRAIADHPPGAPDGLRVVHGGVIVKLGRAQLDRVRNQAHRRSQGSVNAARRRVADMLLDALWDRYLDIGGPEPEPGAPVQGELALWEGILAESGLGALDDEEEGRPPARTSREAFVKNVREQRAFTDFLTAWWPLRTPLDVLRSLGDRARMRRAAGRDLDRPHADLLAESWSTTLAGDVPTLSYQDVALLDEIDALLGPPPRPPRNAAPADEDPYVVDGVNIITGEDVTDDDWEPELRELTTSLERLERSRRVDDEVTDPRPEYAHIVVDEAQDLSPLQWRMLARRGRQATWTIVEDPAQSAWEDLDEARRAMESALGGPTGKRRGRNSAPRRPRHEYELTTNYRNTTEIAAVSDRVLELALPSARPARAVRTSGQDPVIQVVPGGILRTEARKAVDTLLTQVEGTIGLIVPQLDGTWTPQDLTTLGAGLPERVQVLDVLEAKGLEFDAAVICAPETITTQSPRGLRVLYVAVSRATQRLTVLTADPTWRTVLTGLR